ncbi:MAG TPA: Gfo/Idh/MocA family oxidoreductase, partial [Gaiellaceae bacterium]|nr:Gfo/Idh/MocA family oxidoreductase [Gaiellaceae bacterium]
MGLGLGLLSTAAINGRVIAGAPGGIEIAAVASRDGARAQAYAREHGISRSHGSYAALLDEPAVDAVYISLPNGLHHEWTMNALEAGKHVLCEKPYTRRPADVEAAWDLAARSGLVVAEAFMWRHHPQARRARELVESGAIGRLRLLRATFSFPL